MKSLRLLFVVLCSGAMAFGQNNPGWQVAPLEPDPQKTAEWIASVADTSGPGSLDIGPLDESGATVTDEDAALSLGRAQRSEHLPSALRSGAVGNVADEITPEIQAIAAGLKNDPVKIFEYVRNYIDYECYYGSKKGAHLTLLEGSGNDTDQASLLIALLRAAGHTANYGYGPCQFSLGAFPEWWGISTTPFSYMTDSVFASTFGITDLSPANIARWRLRVAVRETAKAGGYYFVEPFVDTIEWVAIPYTFVEFTSGGTTYNLSPAYKLYTTTAGLDLVAATQYNRANLLSSAGGTTGSPDWVSGLSESGINTRLSTYTNNLLTTLRSGTNHEKAVRSIIGGRRISKTTYTLVTDLPGMAPRTASTWATVETNKSELPTTMMSKLEITAGVTGSYNAGTDTFSSTIFQNEITMPSLQGKKLSLSFSGNTASIFLDETPVGSPFTVTGSSFELRLKAKHGHYFLSGSGSTWVHTNQNHTDQSWEAIYKKADTYAYAFTYSFGDADKQLRNSQKKLEAYRRNPTIAATDWRIRTEGMNVMGLTYFKQVREMENAAGKLYQAIPVNHHQFGRTGQEAAFYLDMGLIYSAPIQANINYDVREDFSQMTMLFASAMEHGVIQQTQGAGTLAASTMSIIRKANADSLRIYRATSSNKASVMSGLTNYSTATKASLSGMLTAAKDVMLLPQSGTITINEWAGGGYAFENDTRSLMAISQGLNGGYSAYNNLTYSLILASMGFTADPGATLGMSSYYPEASYMPLGTKMMYSWDPVEMASGAYTLDKTDLTLGSGTAPLGMAFSRQYHSNRRYDASPGLGYGWTHNNDIFITERSAPEAIMGAANGYQMAPFIAALVAAKDLHINHANAKEWATAALVINWALDQMKYTAVSLTMGNQSLQFIKMPDGHFEGPPGMKVTLTVNGSGNYVVTERHGNIMTFNSDKKVATIKNPNGATLTFGYNGSKQLTTVTDAFTRTLTYAWSGTNITSVTDGRSTVSFGYDAGDMTSFTDPESKDWTYHYDADHQMDYLKDPEDRFIAKNEFDDDGRVTKQWSKGELDHEWTYLYTGYVNTEINPLGDSTLYYHDERGRSIGVENPKKEFFVCSYDGQDRRIVQLSPKLERFDWFYDANNNLEYTQDERGFYTDFYYDTQLRLQRMYDPRGKLTTFDYTTNHQLKTVTDALGHTTNYTYFPNGLPETLTDGEGKTTTTAYDSNGNVNKITTHDGKEQNFTNSAQGDILTVTDAESRTTTNTWNFRRQLLTSTLPPIPGEPAAVVTNVYDDSGNIFTSTDPKGKVTTRTWNSLGKPVGTTLPPLAAGSNTLTTTYDERDWATAVTNSLGHDATTGYDSAGRATSFTDSLDRTTVTEFDKNGRATQVTDPLLRVSKFIWNARGEKTRTTNPLTDYVESTLDGNGNQTKLRNRRGKNYSTIFDDANRPTSTTTASGKTSVMTYYNNNKVRTIQEPSLQTTTLGYNGRNLLSSKTDPTGTITYGYDDSGLLETVTEGTAVITRGYDERGKLKSYSVSEGGVVQYTLGYLYDENGNLRRITYPDNKQVNYTYNAQNSLETVTDWRNKTTTYHYDRLGRLTGISRTNGTSTIYDRDSANQLLSIKESSAGSLFSYVGLNYDAAGQTKNRFQAPIVNSVWQHPTFDATYDDDNRLLTANGASVVHDVDGNMTSGPITPTSGNVALVYNSRNQLTSAGGITYTYDAEGVRRTSTDSTGTTKYRVDPQGTLSRLLVKEAPGGGKTFYVYGLGLLYEVDEADQAINYHFDQVGSTIARTDDTGKVVGRAAYSAYGLVFSTSGNMATPFQFNGEQGIFTDANGLLHMRARYYSPYLMRFLNADPIGFSGGLNWFAYADGNPIANTDPFGLWSWSQTFGVVKAVGGAFEAVAGVALATATGVSGVGLVAGIAVAAHGIDTFQSGIRQAFTGEQTDTFTSQGLQAAGMSQQSANLVDAGIGIVGSFGASAASGALRTSAGLVHLTAESNMASIAATQVLKGSTYAGPASNAAATGAMVTLKTGLNPGTYAAVKIPAAAESAFSRVVGVGPYTSWQAAMGHSYTAKGTLDLATGAFTRTGANLTQPFVSALDALFSAARLAGAMK